MSRHRRPEPDEPTIPLPKLTVMNRLGEVGIWGVADRLSDLRSDLTVRSDHVQSGYAVLGQIGASFSDEPRVGVRTHLPRAPHGYVLCLFDPGSANRAAALMLQDTNVDVATAETSMAESALSELGNMLSSGFLDAWADRFDGEIDLSTPQLVRNTEQQIIEETVRQDRDLGIYVGSRLTIEEYDIGATVYLFPGTKTFIGILSRLDPSLGGA
jgi:chemotaxis protein CheC